MRPFLYVLKREIVASRAKRSEDSTMTQHDRSLSPATRSTATGEVPFEADTLLYSRTDKRGLLVDVSTDFCNVSGYDYSELVGAAHKNMPHPDMPKGIGQLSTERLGAGLQMLAYVKNKSKDGRYFWVLSVSWPLEEGYLSIRIKPMSEVRDKVEAAYKTLHADEEEQKLSSAQSVANVITAVQSYGFMDYEDFMSRTLRAEVEAIAENHHTQLSAAQQRYFSMYDTVVKLGREVTGLVDVIQAIRTMPMNMRILASRLENVGGPISAISVNYSQMLEDMSSWIKEFSDGPKSTFSRIKGEIAKGQFQVCANDLLTRMAAQYAEEVKGGDPRKLKEQEILEAQAAASRDYANDALKSIETEVRRLSRSVLDMKRYVTGLSSTRMMCKIEAASLGNSDTALNGIVEQLDDRQNEIERRLAQIIELNAGIQGDSAMLRSME